VTGPVRCKNGQRHRAAEKARHVRQSEGEGDEEQRLIVIVSLGVMKSEARAATQVLRRVVQQRRCTATIVATAKRAVPVCVPSTMLVGMPREANRA